MRTLTATGVLLGLLVALGPAEAQRAEAPYGYIIFYTKSDGKPFSEGKHIRIKGKTTNFKTAQGWFDELNSVHMYRAFKLELKNKAQYDLAESVVDEKNKEMARGKVDPKTPSIAGTKWRKGGDYLWFDEGGRWEIGSDRGIVSNERGYWKQEGNKIHISSSPGGRSFAITLEGRELHWGIAYLSKIY